MFFFRLPIYESIAAIFWQSASYVGDLEAVWGKFSQLLNCYNYFFFVSYPHSDFEYAKELSSPILEKLIRKHTFWLPVTRLWPVPFKLCLLVCVCVCVCVCVWEGGGGLHNNFEYMKQLSSSICEKLIRKYKFWHLLTRLLAPSDRFFGTL